MFLEFFFKMYLLHIFELKIIVGSKFSPSSLFLKIFRKCHIYCVFPRFSENHNGNVFEILPSEMNERHQFWMFKCIISILPPIVDEVLNQNRILSIQRQLVVKTTMRINLFYKIKVIFKYYIHTYYVFIQTVITLI